MWSPWSFGSVFVLLLHVTLAVDVRIGLLLGEQASERVIAISRVVQQIQQSGGLSCDPSVRMDLRFQVAVRKDEKFSSLAPAATYTRYATALDTMSMTVSQRPNDDLWPRAPKFAFDLTPQNSSLNELPSHLVIGPRFTSQTDQLLPLIHTLGVPVLSYQASGSQLTPPYDSDIDRDYNDSDSFFLRVSSSTRQVALVIRAMCDRMDWENIGVLTMLHDNFGADVEQSLRRAGLRTTSFLMPLTLEEALSGDNVDDACYAAATELTEKVANSTQHVFAVAVLSVCMDATVAALRDGGLLGQTRHVFIFLQVQLDQVQQQARSSGRFAVASSDLTGTFGVKIRSEWNESHPLLDHFDKDELVGLDARVYDALAVGACAVFNAADTGTATPKRVREELLKMQWHSPNTRDATLSLLPNGDLDGVFSLYNWRASSEEFVEVGSLTEKTGLSELGTVIWPDGSVGVEGAPTDSLRIRVVLRDTSRAAEIAVSVLTGITAAGVLVVSVLQLKYRKVPILLSGSPRLLVLVLIGAIMSLAVVLMAALNTASKSSCATQMWLGAIAFTFTFGTVAARTYRVFRIYCMKVLGVLSISDAQLFLYIGVMTLIDVALLASATIVPDAFDERVLRGDDNSLKSDPNKVGLMIREDVSVCGIISGGPPTARVLAFALLLWKALQLVVASLMAFSTRHVPADDLNDSKSTAVCVLVTSLVSLLIVPTVLILDEREVTGRFVLSSLGVLVCVWVVLVCLFAPKLRRVLRGERDVQLGGGYQSRSSSGGLSRGVDVSLSTVRHPNQSTRPTVTAGGTGGTSTVN